METFVAIFSQLGVDSSLKYQFVILVVVFIAAQFIFLGKLQNVLEVREEKTIKLENSADDVLEKATAMQNEYKAKIDEAHRVALKTSTEKKQKITQQYTEQYKQSEKELGQLVDQSRSAFGKEIETNKEKYLAESESLSNSLVQKILQ
jgi:F0F1-type ATP synthase membrane subunit b/b'